MRICYVSRECSPFTGGGIGTYIRNVLRAMRDAGHEVTLVSDFLDQEDQAEAARALRDEGIEVIVPAPLPDDLASCFYLFDHEYAERVYREVRRAGAERRFDAVEFPEYRAEGLTCIRAKRLLGEFRDTALVVKCHTPRSLLFEINEQAGIDSRLVFQFWMEDYVVRHADRVTSPSASLAEYFAARLGAGGITRSPYPLTLPRVGARADGEAAPAIVFVGRLEWRKGIDLLLRSAIPVLEEFPDCTLECYGEDTPTAPFETSVREYLERRVLTPGVRERVRLHGQTPYEQVLDAMGAARVCVFPSRWENWPNVCLESMSLGTPVVASRRGGMAEMVEDGTSGYLVDPSDVAAMGARIRELVADRELARRMGEAAARRARELCDPARCAAELEASYAPVPVPAMEGGAAAGRVSVVIPFYNAEQWLQEAVDSALGSDYPDLEVVLVDDGSTRPESIAAFDRIADPRIRKVRKRNGGLASARNAGIAAATGEFVLPLDADDKIHPAYVRAGVAALRRNPELGYVTCYVRNFDALDDHYVPLGLVRELMLVTNPAGKCTSLFRKAVIEELGGYDERMISFEDWDLLCRLAASRWDGDVLPRAFFLYRRHVESLVFTVALPRQLPLMQYMVRKNRELRERYGEDLLRIAVEFWMGAAAAADPATAGAVPRAGLLRRLLRAPLRWISDLGGREPDSWAREALKWKAEVKRLSACWEQQHAWIRRQDALIEQLRKERDLLKGAGG